MNEPKTKKRVLGVWQDPELTKKETKKIMRKERWKVLPGGKVLREKGYSNLANAISTYHGGFVKFRKALGQQQMQGRWYSLDYTLSEARKIVKRMGELPGAQVLRGLNTSLEAAIIKYHGGMHRFRKLLGEDTKNIPQGSWADLEFAIGQAKEAMKERGYETLPNQQELQRAGYWSLVNAISRYHGGLPKFRQILEERISGRTETQQLRSLLETYVGENENK